MVVPTSVCAVCGNRQLFEAEDGVSVRDSFRCDACGSMLRQRDVAQIVVDHYSGGTAFHVEQLVAKGLLDDVDIYEIGLRGPMRQRLRRLPRYVQSYYWEDVPLGSMRDGAYCQDLRHLTFADRSFDLVLSFDVLEHVFDIDRCLSEVARVLRPGGMHVFSTPADYPLPAASTIRATMGDDGTISHLLEPRYHVGGEGDPSLLVTESGADLIEWHRAVGLPLTMIRRSAPSIPEAFNLTFVARKPG